MTKVKKIYVENKLIFEEKSRDKKFIDLEGQKFNRLKIIGFSGKRGRYLYWYCKCDCGNIVSVKSSHIRDGRIKSCGCFRNEVSSKLNETHSYCGTLTYSTWCSMIWRCSTKDDKSYKSYGGRGIKVCDRWLKFENFLEDMGDRPSDKHTLDRIDNDSNYCPENCRWATITQQANNKTSNIFIAYNGVTLTLAQWELKLGIYRGCLSARLKKGMSAEEALTTPINNKRCKKYSH